MKIHVKRNLKKKKHLSFLYEREKEKEKKKKKNHPFFFSILLTLSVFSPQKRAAQPLKIFVSLFT
jgi:dolichol kinase